MTIGSPTYQREMILGGPPKLRTCKFCYEPERDHREHTREECLSRVNRDLEVARKRVEMLEKRLKNIPL